MIERRGAATETLRAAASPNVFSTPRNPLARRYLTVGIAYLALMACSVAMLFPLFWMLSTSLKVLPQVYIFPPVWIPNPVVWANYPEALGLFPFWLYLRNTVFLVVMVTLGNLISCSAVAYGFAKLHAPGKNALFGVLLATLMLPEHVTLIPTFVLFQKLGMVNTYWPLFLPAWFARSAFSVFLLRQFFLTLPDELSDAARIDGANNLTILWRIVAPLAKPVLATIAVFSFMGVWNDFLNPIIYLNDDKKFTLALGLLAMIGVSNQGGVVQWNILLAATTVVMLPMGIVFFVAQRYFIQGIALTGLKA